MSNVTLMNVGSDVLRDRMSINVCRHMESKLAKVSNMATNMSGIGELLGQVGSSVRTAGAGAAAGGGETIFAQLLEGLGVVAPATDAVAPAQTTRSEAENLAEASLTTPTEMLALCAVPMAPQEPLPVPPLIAAKQVLDTPSVAIEQPATGRMQTAATPQPSTPVGPSNTLTLTDMQWLHSQPVAAAPTAQPTAPTVPSLPGQPQQNQPQQNQVQQHPPQQMPALEPQQLQQTQAYQASKGLTDGDTPVERQVLLQTVMPQIAPMAAAVNAQLAAPLQDEQLETSSFDVSGALSSAQLQTSGTQLSDDANAIALAPRHQLHTQVGTHQWATELGNKLTLLATKDTQSATLYMTPADLGPVQVRIDMNQDQDQASVWFTAERAETRSALEQSLPRLREMFAAQGMSLTDAGVFGDRSRHQQPEPEPSANRLLGSQYLSGEELADTATVRSISLGLLDAYA